MYKIALSCALLCSATVSGINRYVDVSGVDGINDCSVIGSPCLTLQHTVNQSIAGDIVIMAAGTYAVSGLVNVNKTLTIRGAQTGIDARTRVGAETILSNTQGISVSAHNVVFDGLTIQDSSVSAFTGYGIWLNPGINGTQIINNIFQNNIVGLGISNGGASQCLVQHNLFKDNNLPGASSGTGIYTDQYVSGQVSNVLINENTFANNDNAGIGFGSNDTNNPDSFITITNNVINNCGRGIYLLNTQSSLISGNTISNLTNPNDGGDSVAIGIYGAVDDLTVINNELSVGTKYGIRIATLIPGSPAPANSNIEIHQNNITGFFVAGIQVDNAPTAPISPITCNWWGSDTGPNNAIFNPSGTGDVVAGDIVAANFNPWLLVPAPEGSCGENFPPTLAKSFNPSVIYKGDKTTITITLTNPNDSPAALTAPLVDNFPKVIHVTGQAKTTCGGTVLVNDDRSKVTLTGGSIPAHGSCTIKLKVTSFVKGTIINTIPAGALVTDKGSNADPAQAKLRVLCRYLYTDNDHIHTCYP